jgi:hypothetical protein
MAENSLLLTPEFINVIEYPDIILTYNTHHKTLTPTKVHKKEVKIENKTIKILKYYDSIGDLQTLVVEENGLIYDVIEEKYVDRPKKILIYSSIFLDKLQVGYVEDVSYSFGKVKSIYTDKQSLFCNGVLIHDDSSL